MPVAAMNNSATATDRLNFIEALRDAFRTFDYDARDLSRSVGDALSHKIAMFMLNHHIAALLSAMFLLSRRCNN